MTFKLSFYYEKLLRLFFSVLSFVFFVIWPITLLYKHQVIPRLDFWFDESGQFWIAKGLDHGSKPLSPNGSLYESILANRRMSLDPGGFTLILRNWIALFGNAAPTLHLLPFTFFILAQLLLILCAYHVIGSFTISCILSSLIYFYYDLIYFSTELRPYSMEAAGVIYLFHLLLKTPKHKPFTTLSGIIVFLTSRYSFIFFAVSFCVSELFLFLKNKKNLSSVLICIISGLFSLFIYFFMLRYQSANMQSPAYVEGGFLLGKNFFQILSLFYLNFLSILALPISMAIIFILIYKPVNYKSLFYFIISVQFLFIVASSLGKMPWLINQRWGLSLQSLSCACLIYLASHLVKFLRSYLRHYLLLLLLLLPALFYISFKTTREFNRPLQDSFYLILPKFHHFLNENSKIIINHDTGTNIRMIYEANIIENSRNVYPQYFVFMNKGESNVDLNIKIHSDLNIKYIGFSRINPESFHIITKGLILNELSYIGGSKIFEIIKRNN